MRWLIGKLGKQIQVTLPDRLVDQQAFALKIAGEDYTATWQRAQHLLTLERPDHPGKQWVLSSRRWQFLQQEDDPSIDIQGEAIIAGQGVVKMTGSAQQHFPGISRPQGAGAGGERWVKAPMAGKILKIMVTEGERVCKGQALAVIEAMKMENQVLAPGDATIKTLSCQTGDQMAPQAKLMLLVMVQAGHDTPS